MQGFLYLLDSNRLYDTCMQSTTETREEMLKQVISSEFKSFLSPGLFVRKIESVCLEASLTVDSHQKWDFSVESCKALLR